MQQAPSPAAENALRLNAQALHAIANRRPAEAGQMLRSAIELDPMLLPARLNLATAQRMEGDLMGALATVDDALRLEPLAFRALLMRASLLEVMGHHRAAAIAYGNALSQTPDEQHLDENTRRAIAHAREFRARNFAEMEDFLLRHAGAPASRTSAEARRMSGFADHLLGKRQRYRSEPTHFFYPGLPSIEFYDREEFPWLPEVEAATDDIRAELTAVLDDEVAAADLEPYMQRSDTEPLEQWMELNKSLKWSAYHFAIYGRHFTKHRERCPRTAALLDRMPQPDIQNRCPASLYSILEPHTHIPAHNGVANFRLLCHLPLILPGNCRFRVGGSIREWKMGEAMVFDDSIEHEAWNDSDQRRAVFIFDIWHPWLSADERDYIRRSLRAIDAFNAQG
jgi:aspartyl/asparaginyl beta-hydroxylase (cupin superfamily)